MPADTAEVGIQEIQAGQDCLSIPCPDTGSVQGPGVERPKFQFIGLLAFIFSIGCVVFCSSIAAYASYYEEPLVLRQSIVGTVTCSMVCLYLYLRKE